MIQDIAPKRLDTAYLPGALPDPDSVVFCFRGRDVLCPENGSLFPVYRDIPADTELRYLFSVDDRKYFLALTELTGDYVYRSVRQVRHETNAPNADILALFTGYHLASWYASSRFCGCCGSATVPGTRERSMVCKGCGNVIYPRINPAVIVGVISGERLLITRYASGYAHDALVAGFTEIGESPEETVRREVMEEVGLRVKNIRYYKSQPWGASMSLLMGFFCDADGDDTVTLDVTELKSAVWVNRPDITGQPDNISLTNEMMMQFRNGVI